MSGAAAADLRYDPAHPARTALRLYSGQRRRLALAAIAFACKQSPVWITPLLTANIIDAVVSRRPVEVIWENAAVMGGLIVVNAPLTWAYVRWLSLALRTVEVESRKALCERLQQLSIGYHKKMSAGVLQTKVIRDVETIIETSRQTFDSGMAASTTLIGALALTAWRVPEFLPVFLLAVPASAGLVHAMRRRMSHHNMAFRRQVDQLSARVSEMTQLIPVTRAHALERDELDRIDSTLYGVRDQGVRLDVLNGRFNAFAWVLFQLLSVGCLVVAAWGARTGALKVTPGDVVLLSTYFVTLTGSVTMLLNVAPLVSKGIESARSMAEVLTEPDLEINEGKQRVDRVVGRVTFEHVTFTYPDAGEPALVDICLNVQAGETVALVGPSGSGKSSMLNLVIGFLTPTSGRLLLDGLDRRDLDLRGYRRFLAVVPQETLLFAGTVRDNVTYGQSDLSEGRVRDALEAANAWEFVEAMGGLDAVVGQRGGQLSGGQRQRLAIARALIRDPRVLVLDEATSALDPASENLVQDALAKLMRGRTSFVVAHRLSTVQRADRIVVLRAGHIVEIGTHDELVAAAGAYVELQGLINRPRADSPTATQAGQ
ncbi:MAG TPA: ABC transporter ATP-binding protein [Acidothermaceae bacterium]|jgi:ATP-binding cassette subfamily B protein|nr:ABC transporter ATP-binding protein [Acidothermaceae bacterium]